MKRHNAGWQAIARDGTVRRLVVEPGPRLIQKLRERGYTVRRIP